MKQFQQFGLVMSACFEAVAYLGLAYYGQNYLNDHYPKSFDWSVVTYSLGLLLIIRSWYVVFRVLVREEKNAVTKSTESESKNGKSN